MEEDLENTQILDRSLETPINEPTEAAAAKTAKLPRLDSGAFRIESEKKEEEFRIGQSRILQKLAANAPGHRRELGGDGARVRLREQLSLPHVARDARVPAEADEGRSHRSKRRVARPGRREGRIVPVPFGQAADQIRRLIAECRHPIAVAAVTHA